MSGKGGGVLQLTTLPPSCADWLEIPGLSTSCSLKSLSRSVKGEVYDISHNAPDLQKTFVMTLIWLKMCTSGKVFERFTEI
jgi:hypothetical protein